jgi:hypothetical protein
LAFKTAGAQRRLQKLYYNAKHSALYDVSQQTALHNFKYSVLHNINIKHAVLYDVS